ncbi:MAG: hypothetical protein H6736_20805, partial [Alphaproteobacteria bacterium]|nr:hypothetical protein [Alphaproteobacteria bacterium]
TDTDTDTVSLEPDCGGEGYTGFLAPWIGEERQWAGVALVAPDGLLPSELVYSTIATGVLEEAGADFTCQAHLGHEGMVWVQDAGALLSTPPASAYAFTVPEDPAGSHPGVTREIRVDLSAAGLVAQPGQVVVTALRNAGDWVEEESGPTGSIGCLSTCEHGGVSSVWSATEEGPFAWQSLAEFGLTKEVALRVEGVRP